MTNLIADIGGIEAISPEWIEKARKHLDQLTKPVGSLGRLEEIAARVVAVQQTTRPDVSKKAVYVFAADHGVAAEGVSAYPSSVTAQMVNNFLQGGAAINALASHANAIIRIIDVGVGAEIQHPGLINRKVRMGSRNMLKEAALSPEELQLAWNAGVELAEQAVAEGLQMVAVGEMGIGNTTSASVITAALTGHPAEAVTGAGTGVHGKSLLNKIEVISDILALHFPNHEAERKPAAEVLLRGGGLEIAAMTAFILKAAQSRLCVVIDGFVSTAAAALAVGLVPAAAGYLFASHLSHELGHLYLFELLHQKPLLDLGMRLGEGTGAVLCFHLIGAAVSIYRDMATFSSAGVSGASPV